MNIKNQLVLLNMVKKRGTYEKHIDGFRVQFVVSEQGLFRRKKPYLKVVVNRQIELREQQYILDKLILNDAKVFFDDTHQKHDTVCLSQTINNKTIDIVMRNVFWMVQAFVELGIEPCHS